jgi:hypothetical protein
MPETKTYAGGCHCGKVKYEVSTALDPVIACNCSICSKRGSLLTFVPPAQFKLQSGQDALSDYQWNKHIIHHLFCKSCGILSFARGRTPKGDEMVAINVRCLEGVDPSKLKVTPFDGRSL